MASFEVLVGNAVDKAELLLIQGCFHDAIEVFAPLISDPRISTLHRISIASTQARIFMTQGHLGLAESCLSEILTLSELPSSNLYHLVRLQYAFVRAISSGDQSTAENAMAAAHPMLLNSLSYEGITNNEIEVETYYQKLVMILQQLRQGNLDSGQTTTTERLRAIIRNLVRQKRFHYAWKLISVFLNASGPSEHRSFLQEILNEGEDIPFAIHGFLKLEMARTCIAKGEHQQGDILLGAADQLFTSCSHSYGREEVRLQRLSHSANPYQNRATELISILQRYCNIDYPVGVFRCGLLVLDLSFQNGDLRTYCSVQSVLDEICGLTGQKYERSLLSVRLLSSFNSFTGHLGKVVELGKALYKQCVHDELFPQAYLVSQSLANGYLVTGNVDEAQHWADLGFRLCKERGISQTSFAAYNLAMIKGNVTGLPDDQGIRQLEDTVSFLQPWVECDLQKDEIKEACQKMCFLASLEFEIGRRGQTQPDVHFKRSQNWLDRAKENALKMDGKDRVLITGSCREQEVIRLFHDGKKLTSLNKEEEALVIIQGLIEDYDKHDMRMQKAIKQQFVAMSLIQMWQKKRDVSLLIRAATQCETAIVAHEAISSTLQIANSRYWLCFILFELWRSNGLSAEFLLDHLELADKIRDQMRLETSAIGGIGALLQKQSMSSGREITEIYRWAMVTSVSIGAYETLWCWCQRRKARSICDMLGLGVIIPESLRQAIAENAETQELFDREREIELRLASTPLDQRATVRGELEDLRVRMQSIPVLADWLSLCYGGTSNLKALDFIFRKAPFSDSNKRDIILIDWISIGGELLMSSVRSSASQQVSCFRLGESIATICRWTEKHFRVLEDRDCRRSCLEMDDLSDPGSPMRALDFIISEISRCSRPGDLLILSPTDVVHSIPLHILGITNELTGSFGHLIERNPILYSSSFTILEKCVLRSSTSATRSKSVFIGVYEPKQPHLRPEKDQVHDSVERLAQDFSGAPYHGSEVNRRTIQHYVANAGLIHFHGHCVFDANNPLEQSLVLTPTPEDDEDISVKLAITSPVTNDMETNSTPDPSLSRRSMEVLLSAPPKPQLLLLNPEDRASHLTVEDIFDLTLSAPHITLIACESASQRVSAGDEPLGLVTGLLCAGAASVLGTMWPIPSITGRVFSEYFYASFEGDCVDLAVALQNSVLEMRDNWRTATPFHWGAFVLHGSWEYKRV
ncbi:MAG: hypothetical protein M1840_002812 [Geoglossum simile]|nr:MAG: hypothetical protein M1840_002812 [Geoglossum simile]